MVEKLNVDLSKMVEKLNVDLTTMVEKQRGF